MQLNCTPISIDLRFFKGVRKLSTLFLIGESECTNYRKLGIRKNGEKNIRARE